MKKYFYIIVFLFIFSVIFLTACSKEETMEDSYWDYENMKTITVEDNKITLVLYEDQALPYRWNYTATDDAIVLIEDISVDKKDMSIQAGVSDSYRVFVFECGEVGEERLYLRLERIGDTDKDVIEKHRYRVTYEEDQLICEEVLLNVEE